MKNKSVYYLTQTAVIAALYAVLTIFQSVIFPESTSAAIQFRKLRESLTDRRSTSNSVRRFLRRKGLNPS